MTRARRAAIVPAVDSLANAAAQALARGDPLGALTRDEQQQLGIAGSGARPADAGDEADDAESELEERIV